MNKDLLRKLLIFGIFFIPFIALVNIGSVAFPFITVKAFIFRIIIELLAGIWVLLIMVEKKYRPRLNWLSGTIFVFLFVMTIADIFGVNPLKSFWGNFERMDGLINIIHMVVYFIIASTIIDTETLWARLFNTTIGVSVILSILGLVQLAGGMTIYTASGRLDSTVGNAAYLALYLLIHIFLTIYMFAKSFDKNKRRYLYIAIVILQTIILYFTATRGSILALIGGIFIIAVLIAIFAREQKKLRIVATATIITVFLIIIGFFVVRNQTFIKNNVVLNRFNSISMEGMKSQARFYIWPMAIQGVKEHPLLGWGQENFNIIYNKYYQPALYNESNYFDRAHNLILDWLVAGGLLGLMAYLSIFIATLYYIWSSKVYLNKSNPWTVIEKSILTGLIASYFLNNIFIFDNITSYILFFTFLAYIYSKIRQAHCNENIAIEVSDRREAKKDRKKEAGKRDMIKVFILPIIIVVLFVVYFLNAQAILAVYKLKQTYGNNNLLKSNSIDIFKEALAENSYGTEEIRQNLVMAAITAKSSPDFDDKTVQDIYNLALTEINKQVQIPPPDAYNYYLSGYLLYTYGRYDDAKMMFGEARKLSPNKQMILSKIGDIDIAQKNYKDALGIAKYSFDLEPLYDNARMTYAIATILNGDKDFASNILVEKFGTDLIFNQELMLAYAETNQIDKLISIYQTRIKDSPNDIQSIISLAAGYLKIGKRDLAIKTLQDAVKQSPDYANRIKIWITQIKSGQNPQ